MSRRLPDHPNLEYLKREAKDLLIERRASTGSRVGTKLKAHVDSTKSSLAGRWSANLHKSRPHALNPFRMASLEISVDGDRATFAFVSVDPRGEEHRGEPIVVIDGHHHAMEHGVGYVAKWLRPGVLEVTATKDGRPTGHGLYEVSPNGQALTVSYFSRSLPGSLGAEHRLVFDRMLA